MCVKGFASPVLLASLALTFGMQAQQSDGPTAASATWNDNELVSIQKNGGNPTGSGEVKIEFGHDAFKITSPEGLTVLADPWPNDATGLYPKWFLNEFPAIRVDVVLSTHAHFDHDAVERPRGLMVLERLGLAMSQWAALPTSINATRRPTTRGMAPRRVLLWRLSAKQRDRV
jgi:Beta-lactamase superfamily domain